MNQLFGLQHRSDRYLSHSSRHTQVPVPATGSSTCPRDWLPATGMIVKGV